MNRARAKGFPRRLAEFNLFESFMGKSEVWSIKAKMLIEAFK